MIPINSSSVRVWSLLGQGGTLGTALLEMAKVNDKIVAVTSDLASVSGLDRFMKIFPDRLINTGIAEQNMVGVAAGFANEGFIPFAISFANFSVLRACEATRHFMGYMQRNVKLIGLGSGFATGVFGNTHYGREDIAIIRAIPDIVILSPADCTELVKALEAAAYYSGPVYIRLTGVLNNPVVYRENFDYTIGKAIELRKGETISIIATGSMVHNSLLASEILDKQGISAKVIDMHTIKPLDTELIEMECISSKMIVSVEEHSTIGGLGGAISEYLSSLHQHPVLLRLGMKDHFQPSGDYHYMLEQNDLLPEQIVTVIKRNLLD
jgi:transketolase